MTPAIDHHSPVPTEQKSSWTNIWKKLGPFIGLIFVLALFSVLRFKTFVTSDNIQIMLLQTAVVGTGALGMTIIIISGGIDLSVGSVVGLSTVVVALLLRAHAPQPLAAAGGVASGILAGFVTGNLVVGQVGRVLAIVIAVSTAAITSYLQWNPWLIIGLSVLVAIAAMTLNRIFVQDRLRGRLALVPFIATLGMMGVLRGVAHWLGDNGTIFVRGSLWLKQLLIILRPGQTWMLFPPGVWMTLVAGVIVALVLRYTRFGRHVFAIGSNERTARLCGVNVDQTKVLVYVIGVGLAGLAGVLQFSYLGMGDSTAAVGMELNIIAAVVIGGASLNGGEGSIIGSLTGALLMTAVANGCTKMDLPTYVQEIITGAIIVAAALLDRLRHFKATE